MADTRRRIVVMTPTYDEAENIAELIREILALPLDADVSVLVVDDDSPDGTGRIAEAWAGRRTHPHPHPKEAPGPGAAGLDGSRRPWRSGRTSSSRWTRTFPPSPPHPGPRRSHGPLRRRPGLAVRPGGRDADRSLVRRLITFLVRLFIRRKFRIRQRTSPRIPLFPEGGPGGRRPRRLHLRRPSVVLEVLYKAYLRGYRIGEVPIVFVDRKRGKTKLDGLTLVETLVAALRIKRRYGPAPGSSRRPEGRSRDEKNETSRLGQHFLVNRSVLDKSSALSARSVRCHRRDRPGKGRPDLPPRERAGRVIAVEKDAAFIPFSAKRPART